MYISIAYCKIAYYGYTIPVLQLSKSEVIEAVAAELDKYPGNEYKQELITRTAFHFLSVVFIVSTWSFYRQIPVYLANHYRQSADSEIPASKAVSHSSSILGCLSVVVYMHEYRNISKSTRRLSLI